MTITLIGYYGAQNIGDDLMLENLLQYFEKISRIKKIFVFCAENYYKLSSKKIIFITPSSRPYRLRKYFVLASSDIVVWGGGTCLYEASDNTGLYELEKWQRLAHVFGAKFVFLDIGIGTVVSQNVKSTILKLLNDADKVIFREEYSHYRAYAEFGCDTVCTVGGDLVFLGYQDLFLDKSKQNTIQNISFSGVLGIDEEKIHVYINLLIQCIDKGAKIFFLPAHLGMHNDNDLHKKIAAKLPSHSYELCEWTSPEKYIDILNQMDFHIGMRLHSIILADILGIPNLAITYSPKVKFYIKKTEILVMDRIVSLYENIEFNKLLNINLKYANERLRHHNFFKNEYELALKSCNDLLEEKV